jgi:hypothetical protein
VHTLRRAVAIVLAAGLLAGCANQTRAQKIMLPTGLGLVVLGGVLVLTAEKECSPDEVLAMPDECNMRDPNEAMEAFAYTAIAAGAILTILGLGPGS